MYIAEMIVVYGTIIVSIGFLINVIVYLWRYKGKTQGKT